MLSKNKAKISESIYVLLIFPHLVDIHLFLYNGPTTIPKYPNIGLLAKCEIT